MGLRFGKKDQGHVSRKKVLVITYYWYPFAGVGAYRISRFIKYLIKSGWDVVILTSEKSAIGMTEVPDDPVLETCKIYRSPIIEPVVFLSSPKKSAGATSNSSIFYRSDASLKSKLAVWVRLNLMVPDAKFTWKWFAVSLGKKIIQKEQPDLILSTSPPPTTNLIAKKLSAWSKLPWLADFRDPWTNIYYYDDNPQGTWAEKKNKKLEEKVLQDADQITVVNHGFFPEYNLGEKVTKIPNGFDPDHVPGLEPTENTKQPFTIRYFGSLKTNQHPEAFIKALERIENKYPELASDLSFEFFGSIDRITKQDFETSCTIINTEFNAYIAHDKMMELITCSNLLLLTIGKTRNSKFVLSTKVFDYMVSGKPVLGIGPVDGSAAELVKSTNIGSFFDHCDTEGVYDFIVKMYKANQRDEVLFKSSKDVVDLYSFKNLTEKLKLIMDSLTS